MPSVRVPLRQMENSRQETLSILMPCLDAIRYLDEAISSVLRETAVLELVVSDGGSTDGSIECLQNWQIRDQRVRLVSRCDHGLGEGLNSAFVHARGTILGWLNADDLYVSGAPDRALESLRMHPEWLMVYGEGEHIDSSGIPNNPYPTRRPSVGLQGFRDYCFICQPTVFWRRSMGIMLGPFSTKLRTAIDLDYWMRAFSSFPDRIGHVPQLQAQTRIHPHTISVNQLDQAVLEVTGLQHQWFSDASTHILERHLRDLLNNPPLITHGKAGSCHAQELLQRAESFVAHSKLQALRSALQELILPHAQNHPICHLDAQRRPDDHQRSAAQPQG